MDEKPGPVFTARFSSGCAMGDDIEEGEDIVMFDGEAYHEGCAIEAGLEVD